MCPIVPGPSGGRRCGMVPRRRRAARFRRQIRLQTLDPLSVFHQSCQQSPPPPSECPPSPARHSRRDRPLCSSRRKPPLAHRATETSRHSLSPAKMPRRAGDVPVYRSTPQRRFLFGDLRRSAQLFHHVTLFTPYVCRRRVTSTFQQELACILRALPAHQPDNTQKGLRRLLNFIAGRGDPAGGGRSPVRVDPASIG